MDYPGWTIETTHPVAEGEEGFCQACAGAVAPTVAFAVNMESPAHTHQFSQPEGTEHRVTVRAV